MTKLDKIYRNGDQTRTLCLKGRTALGFGDVIIVEGEPFLVDSVHYHEQGGYTYVDAFAFKLQDTLSVKDVNTCSG